MENPRCPHCGAALRQLWYCRLEDGRIVPDHAVDDEDAWLCNACGAEMIVAPDDVAKRIAEVQSQLDKINQIMDEFGYPRMVARGLVGNQMWVTLAPPNKRRRRKRRV
jgi:hypothetical protein